MSSKFQIFNLLVTLALVNLLAMANGQNFIIGDKVYRAITTQKVNWYRAHQVCNMLGMQLASIETESDYKDLRTSMFENSLLTNNFWLAGNNLADHGEYVWISSGQKFSYTKWSPSQPGILANRCVRTNSNFDWTADACTNSNYILCQKPVIPDCGVYGGCTNNYLYYY